MEKIKYIVPTIEIVKLDNGISLALESEPPVGPNESRIPDYFNIDPYKTNMG